MTGKGVRWTLGARQIPAVGELDIRSWLKRLHSCKPVRSVFGSDSRVPPPLLHFQPIFQQCQQQLILGDTEMMLSSAWMPAGACRT